MCYDSIARNNVLYNIALTGLQASGAKNCKFYNNTVYNCSTTNGENWAGLRACPAEHTAGAKEGDDKYCNNVEFKNNIVVINNSSGVFFKASDPTFGSYSNSTRQERMGRLSLDHNLYFNMSGANPSFIFEGHKETGISNWRDYTSSYGNTQDEHSIVADPKFLSVNPSDVDFLKLSEDSSAIDAGAHLGSEVEADFQGTARPYGNGYDIGAYEFSGDSQPNDTTPPDDITNFIATPGDGEVTLSWTNPGDSDFAGVMIRYRTDTWPADYNDGQLVCNKTGEPGSSDSFVHSGLQNGITCYYSAFTYDTSGNYSQAAHVSATPGPSGGANQPPTASISASPTSGESPLTVSFSGTASDSDGTIRSYSWDFGDGATSTSQNPTHTYARVSSEKQYTVTLTVTDDDGATGQATTTITVSPDTTPPMAPQNVTVE